MSRTRLALTAAACIATLGIAGCSQADSGTPTPDPQTSNPTSTSQNSDKLSIANPKNLEAVAAKPCELLTPKQLTQLGTTTATKQRPSPWGQKTCTWGADSDGLRVSVAPATQRDIGLKSALRSIDKKKPTKQVNGYPLVVTQPMTYSCGVYVAANSEDVFSLTADKGRSESAKQQDTCAVAKKAAGMVLSNLPPLNK